MATLYELADELRDAIAEHVDLETGEIAEEGLSALDRVEMAFRVKALNVAAYVRSLQMKADGFRGEAESVMGHAKALQARGRACENEARRLTEYLQAHLEDGQKLEDERVRIGWGTATSVALKAKPEELPTWALKKRPPEASLSALKEALSDPERADEAMEYAFLNKRRYLRIR